MKTKSILLLFLIFALQLQAQRFDISSFTPDRKLNLAEGIIENYYVDSVDTEKVVEQAIIAMLKTLDPHSAYSTPEETRQLNEPLEGNFSGIGVRFQMLNDTLYVIESVHGGPSEELGITQGDRIIACNDTVIAGVKMKNTDIMKILRGPKGTVANLKVVRRGVREPIEFRVVRRDIPINSVDAAFMADATTGVIVLTRFADNTLAEVEEAMQSLSKQGMKNLILDLTGNSGGYLRSAYEVANIFLRKGDMLVYTDSPKLGMSEYRAPVSGPFLKGRVVVMVDQYSASAAEIVAGAIQDNDRGVIVGRRTFGKGLVQRPFPFPDGSMIRLTVARYYTPSGRCIQKPYTDGDDKDYSGDIQHRYSTGELMNADSAYHFADSLLYHTIRNHRPVYGGGGIMPDRFVGLDTTFFTPWYRDVVAKGLLNKFCVNYVEANRASIKARYKDAKSFVDKFVVTPEIMNELIDMARQEGVEPVSEQIERSEAYTADIVKGVIGRDIYGQATYYMAVYGSNPVFEEALKIINSPDIYNSLLGN